MKESYQIASKADTRKIADYLARNGQLLMPMVELIEGASMAVDELIDVLGRASVEAVLNLSARKVPSAISFECLGSVTLRPVWECRQTS